MKYAFHDDRKEHYEPWHILQIDIRQILFSVKAVGEGSIAFANEQSSSSDYSYIMLSLLYARMHYIMFA